MLVLCSQISASNTIVVHVWLKQVLLNLPEKKNAWVIKEIDRITGTWLWGF